MKFVDLSPEDQLRVCNCNACRTVDNLAAIIDRLQLQVKTLVDSSEAINIELGKVEERTKWLLSRLGVLMLFDFDNAEKNCCTTVAPNWSVDGSPYTFPAVPYKGKCTCQACENARSDDQQYHDKSGAYAQICVNPFEVDY